MVGARHELLLATVVTGHSLAATSHRYDYVEPLLAFLAAFVFLILLFLGRDRVDLLRKGWRFRILYLAALAITLAIALALARDWLYPSRAFRAFGLRVALTAESRTRLEGREPRAVWSWTLSPGSPAAGAVALAALATAAGFGALVVTTEVLAQPRFAVPLVLRERPGRLEDWLARRERRKGEGKSRADGRHRLAVPDLVTVILERTHGGGWKAWSVDLDDFRAEAAKLEDLVAEAYRDVHDRFANPGDGAGSLCLQYLCSDTGQAQSPSGVKRKDVLFDVSVLAGGDYAAQSVDDPSARYHGQTLEDLMQTVAASGVRNANYTWRRDVKL
jgi:hypothetical protein